MTSEPSRLERTLEERLHAESTDVADVAGMRARVLDALEAQDRSPVADRSSPFRARRAASNGTTIRNGNRAGFAVAGIAACLALAMAIAARDDRGAVVVTATDDTEADIEATSAATLVATDEFRLDLSIDLPTEEHGTWVLESEADDVLSLRFDAVDGELAPRLVRIVAPPPATTTTDIVDAIQSSLFDTAIVSDGDAQIGGFITRLVRLETVAGTTRLSFKIANGTYLSTNGADRVYLAHITTAGSQPLVFWVEASPAGIDAFAPVADRLVEAIQLG